MTTAELEKLLLQKSYRHTAARIQSIIESNHTQLLPYFTDRFIEGVKNGASITSMTWGNIARAHPAWIQPYQERIYRASVANIQIGVRRNAIRYLSEIPVLLDDEHPVPKWVKKKNFVYYRSSKIDEQKNGPYYIEPELEGYLLDHILAVIADPNEVAAPKAFGIQLATNLCLKYPEISNELIPIIQEAMSYGTSGVKFRGKRAIDLLERLISGDGI